jgi:hypothetical protein
LPIEDHGQKIYFRIFVEAVLSIRAKRITKKSPWKWDRIGNVVVMNPERQQACLP